MSNRFFLSASAALCLVCCTEKSVQISAEIVLEGERTDSLFLDAKPGEAKYLLLSCDSQWQATTSNNWIVMTPSSGEGSKKKTIYITAYDNESNSPRTGNIVFSSSESQIRVAVLQKTDYIEPVIPPQDIEDEPVQTDSSILAWWTVGNNDFMVQWNSINANCWIGHGEIPAEKPNGTTAIAMWNVGEESEQTDRTFIISSDGAGHWAVKPTWLNDNMTFNVPLQNVAVGDTVKVRFAIQTNVATVPRYWCFECKNEDGSWTATTSYALPAIKKTVNIDEQIILSAAQVQAGILNTRLRCHDASTGAGGAALTALSTASALRFTPRTGVLDDYHDAISFTLSKKR